MLLAKKYGREILREDAWTPENSKKQTQILELFSAKKFIISKNENYNKIEKVGRKIGKIK